MFFFQNQAKAAHTIEVRHRKSSALNVFFQNPAKAAHTLKVRHRKSSALNVTCYRLSYIHGVRMLHIMLQFSCQQKIPR